MRVLLSFLALLVTSACLGGPSEEQFFKGAIKTRLERMEGYPLDQQYRIYLYGNQVIHPPATGLAIPLAKKGKPALDFILNELHGSKNDLDFRDSLVVIQTMQWGGYYDVCGDATAMDAIRKNQGKIRNPAWRKVYGQMLDDVCRARSPVTDGGHAP